MRAQRAVSASALISPIRVEECREDREERQEERHDRVENPLLGRGHNTKKQVLTHMPPD